MYCEVGCLGLNCAIAVKTEGQKVVGTEPNCMQINRPACIQH